MLLEGIETLLVLSKEKTMSRTGSQLYISQSAVSKRIANLEKKLGKKLVVPAGRHIKLTAEAEQLIANIGPTFNELRGLIFEQQALEDDTLIRLDCSETLVAGYLTQVMGEYRQRDPHFTITTHHTPRIVEQVQSGKATLGLCAGYLPGNHGLMTQHLFDEPFYIVSRQPLSTLPDEVVTNDLTNPANTYQADILARLGINPVMEMDSYTASAQLALGGMAPALVPLSIVNALKIESQYCFDFAELAPLFRPIHICLRATSYRSPRVRTLIETIVSAVPTAV
ncbi:LysR family transcriptional regulator [Vibrio navarrensis]|uniref:LysR family transcriptional regulator n=1 Tax=Vibrio navarrensis TaxID=29495 RepID=UPI001867EFD0|nr:LysR family transcriptional regulator [Vibrio navarrensis]MBE3658356.1 LysR family transcriptional regulator [Vibrio navarrensis]MBE3669579.1 LysR family transcriptional regulator [Vibrio navarrensis]